MRFLHCVAALAALSSVSGVTWDTTSCKIKSTSTSSTACATTDSTLTEIVTGSPAVITIPSFDPTTAFPGAILDNVYINFIDAVYNPTVTYQVAGSNTSATLTGFSVSVSVNIGWGLFSSVDSKTLTSAVLQSAVNGLGLGGEASVDTGSDDTTTGCLGGTDTYTPSHILFCQAIGVQGKPFQLTDDQYKTAVLHQTDGLINFKADYSAPGTYVNYVGPDMSISSGFRVTPSTPAAGYSNAGTWSLTTSASTNFAVPAAVPGSFGVSGASGSQVTVNVAQSLKLQVNVQYDYHVPSVGGDPQFNGFQGQNFQVHGAPDSYFALISAPTYYVNARFDYLSTGRCDYNETQCFTHPGTYMGLIYVGMKDANILIQAGPHDTGFAGILVNDKPIQVGDRFTLSSISANSYIQILSKSKLILSLDNIIITVHNSDLFVNFDLALTDKQLLTTGSTYHVMPNGASPSQIAHKLSKWYGSFNPLHGLIGQTWRNVKYQDNKLYQGDITEYQLDKIIDHTFLYCVYEA